MQARPPGTFHEDMTAVLAMPLQTAAPLPAGAWDCHAHVFGPYAAFPLRPGAAYQPPLSPVGQYVEMLDRLGFAHGVVVQPAAYGYDNAAVLAALAAYPDRLRGVSVVDPDIDPAALRASREAGVRGVRFTEPVGGRPVLGAEVLRLDQLDRLAPKLAEAGLHLQLWADATVIAAEADRLAGLGIPVVIDHLGQPNMANGTDDEAFAGLLRLMRSPNVWMKVQPLRASKQPGDMADARPFFKALLDTAPERLVWGSDWPFIALGLALPNPARLADRLVEWTGDEALVRSMFVDNPARLYA